MDQWLSYRQLVLGLELGQAMLRLMLLHRETNPVANNRGRLRQAKLDRLLERSLGK